MVLYNQGDGVIQPRRWCYTTKAMGLYNLGDGVIQPRRWCYTTKAMVLYNQGDGAIKPRRWFYTTKAMVLYNQGDGAIQPRRWDDGVERPVDDSHCVVQYRPSVAMSCTMECNWDCSVSQWSTWSTCQASDCDGLETSRQRRAEESIDLTAYYQCEGPFLASLRKGGMIDQSIMAQCGGHMCNVTVKVRERYCHETLQAEQNWANCYVSCPEDCIVSEWGSWSSCPNPCNIPVGSRVSRSRTRHVLSPQMLGRPCLFLNNLRQAESCPVLHDCETYQWEVSTWEPCKLDQGHSQCGTGTQSRKVDCRTAKHMWADSDKCLDKIKPVSTQTCLLPCPLDCELTEWSDWSACGATCLPLQARQIYPSQIRKRFILQLPQFGGVRCPEDLVEEQSCLELPVCQTYYWETSEWSDCILAPEFPRCGLGLRARNITCKHANNQNINDVIISVCLENLGFIPDFTEQCHVPCESECQFENWSPWTQCDPPCERSRFRYRGLIGESKRLKECKDSTMEQEECVCAEQAISLGGWSDCIIETPPVHNRRSYSKDYIDRPIYSDGMKHGLLNSCGEGKQYLMLSCQNTNADIMGQMKYCEPKEQQCNVSCPVDCETTEWSSWSSCSVYCGSGIQQRERRIMKMQFNGGRKCPFMFGNDKESQTRVCTIECSYKVWKTDDWGPCFPNSSKSCGEGTHARQIRCVSVGADGSETTIDNNFCEKDEEPATIKSCSLPCPGECVMSEWMEWTPCRQPCNGQQTQKRYRSVLRWPRNYDKIRQCVQQQDERTCERQVNCIEYSWELSDWTSCLVNEGRSDCGVGHKERFAICRNEVGEKVENYRCQKLFGPVTEPLVVSCEIPCDYDCLLSDWSEWTPCSVSCGLGKTLRKRTVLQSPMGNGRKCPEKNEQSKSCFNKGCYRWHASEWSECNIEMNFCGVGVQERNVTCVGDDGRSVNTSKCEKDLANLVTQTSRPCQVPCPGECFLSEWSSWSLCFISCEDFQQGFSMGVQARSRAVLTNPMPSNTPCNTTLWEDRTCEASQCTFFKWSVGEWDSVTGKRSVACERQDGLPVVGGYLFTQGHYRLAGQAAG
ncbi:Thrombospondin type-1 domain-containing protein 7A [Bulinus truncatus]|nr:Thrombospondin type-1 domain-containing protein 7A [Bulinus truncatus]